MPGRGRGAGRCRPDPEQGRAANPSTIGRIAPALRLTDDERRYLDLLAFGRSASPGPRDGHKELIRRLLDTTEASGLPVYAVGVDGWVIAANSATGEWYGLTRGDHFGRWLVLDPRARVRLPHWHDELHDMVARWRLLLGRRPDDDLRREFQHRSPEFAAAWDTGEVGEQRSRLRVVRHPTLGERAFHLVTHTPDRDTTSIVHHLPVP